METNGLTNYFDKEFELRYFETDQCGLASPKTMLTLLEETAAEHCSATNYGLYQLAKQQIGWVLFSGVMEIDRYPAYKEKITIRTWLSKYSRFKGTRENLIYDAQGNIIGRAKGLWVFFDIEKRKPTPIFDDIKKEWSFCDQESIQYQLSKKIQPIDISDDYRTFHVYRYDVDMYRHANNIKYLQWAIESIPEEITDQYYLHSVDSRFVSEVPVGQTIESHIKEEMIEGEDRTFLHTIKRGDTVCATAHTLWRKAKK